MMKQFICGCYFQRNIFIKKYKLHVHFVDEEQFKADYTRVLQRKGLKEDISHVIQQVKNAIEERREDGRKVAERKKFIEKNYVPLHRDVYHLQESFLHPDFLKIVDICKKRESSKPSFMKAITTCKASHIYSFPVFTVEFVQKFVEELKYFEGCDATKGRPINMNTSGLLLYELGFYPHFFDALREKYLMPVATALFPEWIGEKGLDSQRAYMVKYVDEVESGLDTELPLHFDNAEVTLNISLTDSFEGGELFFSGMRQEARKPYSRVDHKKTYGILHRSQHFHGAMPTESGERLNLIIWMRSSSIRNKQCPRCDKQPTLVETLGEGDGYAIDNNSF